MTKYIDKAALVAEINQRIEDYKSYKIDDSYYDGLIFALEDLRDDFIDNLEVKEVDLETDVEREYVKCYIDIFDKKFPIMPTLKGQYLHDYKNFLNKCQQIFGLQYWGIHRKQAILFKKFSLLWATWGAQHLKGLFEISSEEKQKMDIKGE